MLARMWVAAGVLSAIGVVAVGILAFSTQPPPAGDVVVIGGIEYACSNRCVVTGSPGHRVVRDGAQGVARPRAGGEKIARDNIEYHCPNRCVASQGPDGYSVRDSAGAAIATMGAPAIVIDDVEYICPNSCVVAQGPDGPVVRDSEGGRVAEGPVAAPYSATVDPPRLQ